MKYRTVFMSLILVILAAAAVARGQEEEGNQFVDGVVAVVGDEIILMSDLQRQVSSQMMRRNLNPNSPRNQLLALREETLTGMIDDLLLLEKARRDSIEIDMREVDLELKRQIADFKEQAGSEEVFQRELQSYGITELQLRRMFHDMIVKDYLRETLRYRMMSLIAVTPQEMETWVEAHSDSIPEVPERFKLSHILRVPRVSEERLNRELEEAREVLKRARAGEDFGELAREYSDDPGTAERGGDLGYFGRDELLPEFTAAAFSLNVGEISGIVETAYGYHIIKVEDIRGDEVKARHILFHFTPNDEDMEATVQLLAEIREKIVTGEATFAEMAEEYTDHIESRELGGALPWLPNEAGDIIPEFREQAKQLEIGEISPPFKTDYGYHILRLDDYKPAHTLNVRDDRAMIEPIIKNEKFLEEYSQVITRLREETYIEVRLN